MTRISEAHELAATARYLARRAVKDQLQRRGIRPIEVEPADITRAANELLRSNGAELIERAKAILAHR